MLHVDEVLYVTGLRKNLLSVATLEAKGILGDLQGQEGTNVG
jgi:hypothetical protein